MPARYVHAIHFKIVELAHNVVYVVYVVMFALSQVLACGYAFRFKLWRALVQCSIWRQYS